MPVYYTTKKDERTMNTKFLMACMIAGVLVSTTGMAQDGKKGKQQNRGAEMFKQMDKNEDGKLSKEEVADKPRLKEHFDEIDTNKDGFLEKAEMKAFKEKKMGDRK